MKDCDRCHGTGTRSYTNGYNEQHERECLKCKGTGEIPGVVVQTVKVADIWTGYEVEGWYFYSCKPITSYTWQVRMARTEHPLKEVSIDCHPEDWNDADSMARGCAQAVAHYLNCQMEEK